MTEKKYLTSHRESTSIPTNPRTTRPVGYAFVDLVTAEEAEKAIQELSGKSILDRKVSVQLARKPETAEEKAAKGEANPTRRRSSGRGRGRARGRGGRTGRGGRVSLRLPKYGLCLTESQQGSDEQEPLAETTNTAAAPATNGEARSTTDKAAPRQRGPPEDGIPSTTKVMVANLPYEMSEEKVRDFLFNLVAYTNDLRQLKELFAAYSPTAAKIALRPIPRYMIAKLKARNEPRKGRGFGFVSLGSEELQNKAVAEMHGKQIDGREIAVKVAIDSPGKEDIDPEAAGTAPLTENGVVQANDPPAA